MNPVLLAVLVAFTSYRLQRIVTRDDWPPSVWLRDHLRVRALSAGKRSMWDYLYDWATCPWCFGAWTAAGVVIVVDELVALPLPVLWWGFAAALTGLIAEREEPTR